MVKWMGLLCANVFFVFFNNIGIYIVVFNFTLTSSLGANHLSDNVTLSINKRVNWVCGNAVDNALH